MKIQSLPPLIGCLLLASGAASEAASVTSVGTEAGGDPFPVANWSNAGVAKVFDIGGTDLYGTAGYYQLLPNIGVGFSEGAGPGNELGITLSTNPLPAGQQATQYSQPAFTGSMVGGAGNFVNFPGYSIYRGPDGASLYQQGALSLTLTNTGTSPGGSGAWDNAFTFTLTAEASFRIGIAVDSVGDGNYAPDYISVYNVSNATNTFSGLFVVNA